MIIYWILVLTATSGVTAATWKVKTRCSCTERLRGRKREASWIGWRNAIVNSVLKAMPGCSEDRGESTVQQHVDYKGKAGADKMTVSTVFPDMRFGEDPYRSDITKISFILDSYEDYLVAKARFPELKVGTWGGAGEKALFGDI